MQPNMPIQELFLITVRPGALRFGGASHLPQVVVLRIFVNIIRNFHFLLGAWRWPLLNPNATKTSGPIYNIQPIPIEI